MLEKINLPKRSNFERKITDRDLCSTSRKIITLLTKVFGEYPTCYFIAVD